MRVTEQTARRYLDEETIKDMARQMLSSSLVNSPAPI